MINNTQVSLYLSGNTYFFNPSTMINKAIWLLCLVFCWACNNDKKAEAPSAKAATEHSGHNVAPMNNNYSDSVNNGLITADTLKGSPHRTAMATINGTHVHIEYNSPGVKGRVVWGGLVAYDKIWATGAHKATSVQFSNDVSINGQKIPKGQYAFFTIPGKDKWTIILNTRYDQHLADEYNEKEDLVRVEVKPEEHDLVQRLTYAVNTINDKSGEIIMQWEKIVIRLPFTTM
jgi:Protein of unknown function (DUF2911)